jgi:hypothetical protein
MTRTLFNRARLARSKVTRTTLAGAERQDNAAWRKMTPRQRLETVELLRQMNHNYDPATARLPRVYTITQQASR